MTTILLKKMVIHNSQCEAQRQLHHPKLNIPNESSLQIFLIMETKVQFFQFKNPIGLCLHLLGHFLVIIQSLHPMRECHVVA